MEKELGENEASVSSIERLVIRWELHRRVRRSTKDIVSEVIRVSRAVKEIFEMEEKLGVLCPVVVMWSLHKQGVPLKEARRKLRRCVQINEQTIGLISMYLESWLGVGNLFPSASSFLFGNDLEKEIPVV